MVSSIVVIVEEDGPVEVEVVLIEVTVVEVITHTAQIVDLTIELVTTVMKLVTLRVHVPEIIKVRKLPWQWRICFMNQK